VPHQEEGRAGELVGLFRDHRHRQLFPERSAPGSSMLSPASLSSRSTSGDCASARAVLIAFSDSVSGVFDRAPSRRVVIRCCSHLNPQVSPAPSVC
jgi:hypothetical protein